MHKKDKYILFEGFIHESLAIWDLKELDSVYQSSNEYENDATDSSSSIFFKSTDNLCHYPYSALEWIREKDMKLRRKLKNGAIVRPTPIDVPNAIELKMDVSNAVELRKDDTKPDNLTESTHTEQIVTSVLNVKPILEVEPLKKDRKSRRGNKKEKLPSELPEKINQLEDQDKGFKNESQLHLDEKQEHQVEKIPSPQNQTQLEEVSLTSKNIVSFEAVQKQKRTRLKVPKTIDNQIPCKTTAVADSASEIYEKEVIIEKKQQEEQIHSKIPLVDQSSNSPKHNSAVDLEKPYDPFGNDLPKEDFIQSNEKNIDPDEPFRKSIDEVNERDEDPFDLPNRGTSSNKNEEANNSTKNTTNKKYSPFDDEKEFFQFAFYKRYLEMVQRLFPASKKEHVTFLTPIAYFTEENRLLDQFETHNVVLSQSYTAGKKLDNTSESKASRIELLANDEKTREQSRGPHNKNHLGKNHLNIRFDDWTIVYYDFIGIMTLSSNWHRHKSLPFKKIFEYYRRPSFYRLQHLSISTYTLQKIETKKELPIEVDMELLFSDFAVVRIVEIRNERTAKELSEQDRAYLTYLLLYENIDIKGIEIKSLIDQQSLEEFELKHYEKAKLVDWEKELPLGVPYMKIETRLTTENSKSRVLFIADKKEKIKIGRANNSEVLIRHNHCSRHHAEINYNEKYKRWVLIDGNGKEQSKKGSYVNLSTIEEKAESQESRFYPLNTGMNFKITDELDLRFKNDKLDKLREKIRRHK